MTCPLTRISKPFLILLFSLRTALGISTSLHSAEDAQPSTLSFSGNLMCPIQPDEKILKKYATDYNGVTIYFCCENCIGDFYEEPERYVENLPHDMLSEIHKSVSIAATDSSSSPKSIKEITRSYTLLACTLPWVILIIWWLGRRVFIKMRYKTADTVGFCIYDFMYISLCILSLQFFIEDIQEHLTYRRQSKSVFDAAGRNFERDARYHFGQTPRPIKPDIPNSLSSRYYRGNDQRSLSLQNGGQHLTCTFDLALLDEEKQQLDFSQTLHASKAYLRFIITRGPFTPDHLFRKQLMAGVKITDTDDLQTVRDLEDGLALRVLIPDQQWQVDIPITLRNGLNTNVYYVWESRISKQGDALYPKMHYAIEYSVIISNETIDPRSNLWMGFIRTAQPLRRFEIDHREWLNTEPIPALTRPNDSSSARNDSDL